MPVIIESIPVHGDLRGWLFEPLREAELAGQHNVHVAVTEPGHVRGNHYHVRGTEIATVAGPALVRLSDNGTVFDTVVARNEVRRFTIPPRVSHAFRNTGDRPAVLVVFNTEPHDPANPDVVRDVLIEP